ncbi:fluoride efflux transporter CrcB [Entomomonas asaccharolytica]|uniref:Fluoride-specific ion channel FluC n=1 Tax=Entomomonas asaccharolytica TaxID=2785331 RepID=A0A974NDQ9_9GAMM|nr:fluoride efflux transporter CrcB [Entomomonas asaccharolytica]QQP84497.1 fluoride efflux transporter CrcB [Entomomonas asaccharolytica]
MLKAALIIGLGGGLGAILRWVLGLLLNTLFPTIPPGTLVANLLAGYLIGLFLVIFMNNPNMAPEWKLFIITGFLGGLSTFSTFSAEVTTLLQQGRIFWAGAAVSVHVIGSITMTLLGMATVTFFKFLLK